ncbi:HNH endonuclease signature motif containing protein [Salinisphaera hydrothermalis]|nr:HNH endonuclease signature motif containing protein [Salinisphaera hydrothermalis]
MSRGINKDITASDLYQSGMSIPEVSKETGIARSTLRFRFKRQGILRSRSDGVRNAGERGRLGSAMRGKTRTFSATHCQRISESKRAAAEATAVGTSARTDGYVEYTRGPHKGRSVHVVAMEERLGRRLRPDEVVHHIDGDKHNNSHDNLALCTRSGHARLHRREEKIARQENHNGQ